MDLGTVHHLKKLFLEASRLLLILATSFTLEFDLKLPLLLSMLFEPGKQGSDESLRYLLKPSFETPEILLKVFWTIIHVFMLLNPVIILPQLQVALPVRLNISMDTVQYLLHQLPIK